MTIKGIDETKAAMLRYVDAITQDKLLREILHEACEPMAALARSNFQGAGSVYPHGGGPYTLSGETVANIKIRDLPTEGTRVRVAIGGGGGKNGRGYILHFLENGTAHNRAYPVLRPALDSEGPQLAGRVAAAFRKIVGPMWREVFR